MKRSTRAASPGSRTAATRALTRRILVATDGAPAADAALRIAAALVQRDGGNVEVLTVVPPLPVLPPMTGIASDAGLLWSYTPSDDELMAAQRARARTQLERLGVADWPVHVSFGDPAHEIAAAARARRATLVVMGIGRHKPIDRLLGTETALKVIRIAPVPVLAVPQDRERLPRRVVVAVDFSLSSREAARAGLELLADDGVLRLVHVRPLVEFPVRNQDRWIELYDQGAARLFEQMLERLRPSAGVTVETAVMRGDAGHEVLADAEAAGADVVVVGAQEKSRGERILLGSVVAKALRGARCAVLTTPPVAVPAEKREMAAPAARRATKAARRRDREQPA